MLERKHLLLILHKSYKVPGAFPNSCQTLVDMQSFMVIRTYLFVSTYIYVEENNNYTEEGGLF